MLYQTYKHNIKTNSCKWLIQQIAGIIYKITNAISKTWQNKLEKYILLTIFTITFKIQKLLYVCISTSTKNKHVQNMVQINKIYKLIFTIG